MKVILIGDTSGNPDEGMKKVSYRLAESLNLFPDCEVFFVSFSDVLKKRLSYKDVNIIHFMGGPSWRTLIAGFVIRIVLNRSSLIIISFIHPKWNVFSNLFLRVFKPNAVVVQTQKWFDITQKVVKKIRNIPLGGINTSKFHEITASEKYALKKELGLPLDKIIVLHVGHLNTGRNLTVLNQLKDADDIFPLVVGSSTVNTDVDLVGILKKHDVKVLSGYLPEVEKYYMAADCYIFPTINTNFAIQIPLSVLEAIACRIPVLSTRYEALPFFLKETPPLLNYVDSFEGLDKIVRKLHDDFKQIDSFEVIDLNRFEWENIAKELHEFYKNLLLADEK